MIGAAVALELARGGRTVVCVDKGPAPGAGSTSASSSSIIRFSYSTPDAVLTAWEAAALWQDWAGHLGVEDPDGLARFVRTGYLGFITPGYDAERVLALWDDIGIPYRDSTAPPCGPGSRASMSAPTTHPSASTTRRSARTPRTISRPSSRRRAATSTTRCWRPTTSPHAARHHGARFRFREAVVAVEREGGRVTGVTLAGGEAIHAPVVVNVAGPHSGDRQRHGRRRRRDAHRPPPAASGGLRRPGTRRVPPRRRRPRRRRPRPRPVLPSAGRRHAAGRRHRAGVRPAGVDHRPGRLRRPADGRSTGRRRCCASLGACRSSACPPGPSASPRSTTSPTTGCRSTTARACGGFFMACGTSGNQFKNAPLAGQFLRALVDAADAGIDHDAEPVQFTGPRTGRPIDLAAFSRLRTPGVDLRHRDGLTPRNWVTCAIDFCGIPDYGTGVQITAPIGPGGPVRLEPRPFRGWRDGLVAVVLGGDRRRVRRRGRHVGSRRRRARCRLRRDGAARVGRGVPQHVGRQPRRARGPAVGRVAHAAGRRGRRRRHRARRTGHRAVHWRSPADPGRRAARRLARPAGRRRAASPGFLANAERHGARVDPDVWRALRAG